MGDREAHAIALRTRRLFWNGEISDQQEWLFDMIVNELEYRQRSALRAGTRPCVCELCLPPELPSEPPYDHQELDGLI